MGVNLLGGSHFLGALGFNAQSLEEALREMHAEEAYLEGLYDGFSLAAGPGGAGPLARMLRSGNIPQAMMMAPPNQQGCACAAMYAPPPFFGFPPRKAERRRADLNALFSSRRKAKRFEKMLKRKPNRRAQIEMLLGGRIIPDRKNDGKITVQPFAPGHFPGAATPQAMAAMGMLSLRSS